MIFHETVQISGVGTYPCEVRPISADEQVVFTGEYGPTKFRIKLYIQGVDPASIDNNSSLTWNGVAYIPDGGAYPLRMNGRTHHVEVICRKYV